MTNHGFWWRRRTWTKTGDMNRDDKLTSMDALMILQATADTVQYRFVFSGDFMDLIDRTRRDQGGAWQGSLLSATGHIGSGMVIDLLIWPEMHL